MLGAVDRWFSGPAGHSSAQAVIAQTPFPSGRCSSPPMWVGDVVAGEVAYWVLWIADCLVRLATRAPKPCSARVARKRAENRHCRSPPTHRRSGCMSGVLDATPFAELIHLPNNRGAMTRISASRLTPSPKPQLVGHSQHARARDEAPVDHPADRDHREPPVS